MNIIVAPAAFKGSLSAAEAAQAIEAGVRAVIPEAEVASLPLADGGQGTVEALVAATGGRVVRWRALGPLREPVDSYFGILGDDVTGVIEMSAASGLRLVPPERRDPRLTTSFGTGQLIAAALDAGCKKLIIGLGDSATNDGGAGAVQALGVSLMDADGRQLGPGGAELARLERVDVSGLDPRIASATIWLASDVSNPLCGPEGASAVYGPQKGATPEAVEALERALMHYAQVIQRDLKIEIAHRPGAGAAGGLGAGLMAFLGAEMRMGIAVVLQAVRFEDYLRDADLVLTGEGRIDEQVFHGKVLAGVGSAAKKFNVPVIAFAGQVAQETEALEAIGLAACVPICPSPATEAESMAHAAGLLQQAVERTVRVLIVGARLGRVHQAP